MIEYSKKKRKWILYTHDGSRILGTHDTYEDALRQERAIQWAKHRHNPVDKLYCYPPLHMFWTDTQRFRRKMFHVTPYLDRILADGKILPPSRTGMSTLGEGHGEYGKTIRGCLVSFFDDFQNAVRACRALALYALIHKQLLTEDELERAVRLTLSEPHGLLSLSDVELLVESLKKEYRTSFAKGRVERVFYILKERLGFFDPAIISDAWVKDLPDSKEGVLQAIGILEVEVDRKFLIDPTLWVGFGFSEIADDDIPPPFDFGYDLAPLQTHMNDEGVEVTIDDSWDIAYAVNDICALGETTLKAQILNDDCGMLPEDVQYALITNDPATEIPFKGLTLVPSVHVKADEIAVWYSEEEEWRIPALEGIPVDEKTVIARAEDVEVAFAGRLAFVGDLEVRGRRRNPVAVDKLYCYAPLHMFWTDTQRLKKKVFHVTPYLDRVLKDGKLLPPSRTGKSVLGENARSGKTIRGCLLSFFDDFQTAMNGCYSMTLYALITKGLMSEDQFSDLVTRQIESRGILYGFGMFDPQEVHAIVMERFREDDVNTLFALLERAFGFKNPRILTSAWVDDLPDTVEGILDAIGVLEVEIDRKYIADPSALIGKSMSIYEDAHTQPRGDFGYTLESTRAFVGRDWIYATDRELYEMTSHEGAQLAYSVNEICKAGSAELGLRPDLLTRYLMKNFGFEAKDLHRESDGNVTAFNEITFAHSVTVKAEEIAIWNPLENEWRIPAPNGISVDESNVIALAGEVQLSVGSERLVPREDLVIRGRRKNP